MGLCCAGSAQIAPLDVRSRKSSTAWRSDDSRRSLLLGSRFEQACGDHAVASELREAASRGEVVGIETPLEEEREEVLQAVVHEVREAGLAADRWQALGSQSQSLVASELVTWLARTITSRPDSAVAAATAARAPPNASGTARLPPPVDRAIHLCERLLDAGLLHHASQHLGFSNSSQLYRLGPRAIPAEARAAFVVLAKDALKGARWRSNSTTGTGACEEEAALREALSAARADTPKVADRRPSVSLVKGEAPRGSVTEPRPGIEPPSPSLFGPAAAAAACEERPSANASAGGIEEKVEKETREEQPETAATGGGLVSARRVNPRREQKIGPGMSGDGDDRANGGGSGGGGSGGKGGSGVIGAGDRHDALADLVASMPRGLDAEVEADLRSLRRAQSARRKDLPPRETAAAATVADSPSSAARRLSPSRKSDERGFVSVAPTLQEGLRNAKARLSRQDGDAEAQGISSRRSTPMKMRVSDLRLVGRRTTSRREVDRSSHEAKSPHLVDRESSESSALLVVAQPKLICAPSASSGSSADPEARMPSVLLRGTHRASRFAALWDTEDHQLFLCRHQDLGLECRIWVPLDGARYWRSRTLVKPPPQSQRVLSQPQQTTAQQPPPPPSAPQTIPGAVSGDSEATVEAAGASTEKPTLRYRVHLFPTKMDGLAQPFVFSFMTEQERSEFVDMLLRCRVTIDQELGETVTSILSPVQNGLVPFEGAARRASNIPLPASPSAAASPRARPCLPLQEVLSTPPYYRAFLDFCIDALTQENLDFLRAVDTMEFGCNMPPERAARVIFASFISDSARTPVNIDSSTRISTKLLLERGANPVSVFSSAAAAVEALVGSDPYQRFVESAEYKRMQQDKEFVLQLARRAEADEDDSHSPIVPVERLEGLEDLVGLVRQSTLVADHRIGMATVPNSFLGCELVSWLVDNHLCTNRGEALSIGKRLFAAGLIHRVGGAGSGGGAGNEVPQFVDAEKFYTVVRPASRFASTSRSMNHSVAAISESDEASDDAPHGYLLVRGLAYCRFWCQFVAAPARKGRSGRRGPSLHLYATDPAQVRGPAEPRRIVDLRDATAHISEVELLLDRESLVSERITTARLVLPAHANDKLTLRMEHDAINADALPRVDFAAMRRWLLSQGIKATMQSRRQNRGSVNAQRRG